MTPDNPEQPETIISLTIEEAIEFEYTLADMGYGVAIWWAFADIYDTHRYKLIDKGLLERARHLPTHKDGLKRYFPEYPYTLTELGTKIRANSNLIDIVLE